MGRRSLVVREAAEEVVGVGEGLGDQASYVPVLHRVDAAAAVRMGLDQAAQAQLAQMLGHRGSGHAGQLGQFRHVPVCGSERGQQTQPGRVGQQSQQVRRGPGLLAGRLGRLDRQRVRGRVHEHVLSQAWPTPATSITRTTTSTTVRTITAMASTTATATTSRRTTTMPTRAPTTTTSRPATATITGIRMGGVRWRWYGRWWCRTVTTRPTGSTRRWRRAGRGCAAWAGASLR